MEKNSVEKQHSFIFQRRMKDRTKLPIFNKRHAILDLIRANSVVIVKGSTGCGKTTQVIWYNIITNILLFLFHFHIIF